MKLVENIRDIAKIKKLNIGCGNDIKKDYINLDIVNLDGVDVVHDLDKMPYPFKDNTFEEVRAIGIAEHLADLVKSMEELHRICKNGAIIDLDPPYFNSITALADPTHKRFFTLDTFDYFTDKHVYNFYTNARFKILKKELIPTKLGKIIPFKKKLLNKVGLILGGFVRKINFRLEVVK
ncbi:MAG: class I SAM-dependent methyltransferase [Nanoarchaeota archaeon]|nr:class I SAM-dependent methyltransferase [Nanoarchaeota archaeon]MBU1005602.1 class I SAM-dependent methyltransferase [Nanoarchaeota archaeon]MBU1945988.1 class I SAM-dependent methyltransferase [Nanoarchaeota archaeon]